MMRIKDNRLGTTKSVEQFSLMIMIKQEDRILGLTTLRTSISNPDTENRPIRHPINKLASFEIGTETQTQISTITKVDQLTLGTTDPTTVSKLSITSVLDQRNQTLNTIKTFPRVTTYLHPSQFSLLTIKDKI